MKKLVFRVVAAQNKKRIDMALVDLAPDMSRRKLRSIIDLGGCYINGRRVRISSRPVLSGDRIEIVFDEAARGKRSEFSDPLAVDFMLLNDPLMVAVNKPPGLPAQATRDQALVHAAIIAQKRLAEIGEKCGELSPVHRLDKETSGVMLFAKDAKTMTALTEQFKSRSVKKEYWAICFGIPNEMEFKVSNFLSDIHAKTGRVEAVKKGGKGAETEFQLVRFDQRYKVSLIRCFPHTGRSHQIRVHLADLNLPIVGDKKYGINDKPHWLTGEMFELSTKHHFLHAHTIAFDYPDAGRRRIKLEASLPPNFAKFAKLSRIMG